MKKSKTIMMRRGERIFINGAVVRVDRNTSLELLNDVPYLLERQIMQPEQATTSLRQLYFIVQTMVLDPAGVAAASEVFTGTMKWMLDAHRNEEIQAGLSAVNASIAANKPFEALGLVRSLIPIEDAILGLARQVELKLVEAM